MIFRMESIFLLSGIDFNMLNISVIGVFYGPILMLNH